MRVVKDAEVRRNEILDAAQELFAQKGYDQTGTADILKKVNIARGTLYYHFKSKEEVLDGVIDRIIEQMVTMASAAAVSESIPFFDRLLAIIEAFSLSGQHGSELLMQMHKPANAIMHVKVQGRLLQGVTPVLCEWINEGIDRGFFHTDHAREAAEMLIIYVITVFDDLSEQTAEQKIQRIYGLIYNTERLVGAQSGALTAAIEKIFISKGEL